ncbi:MAG: hypothetical protein M1840_003378 [Geoglossum simile]|nr:MAG: hypothetical protein M1840_003378 [Geoglossum simile]
MRGKVILDLPEFSEGPLPNAKGPKLDPFPHNGGHIEFLRLLGAGEHGYVFEVIIESQRYALKMFKFYDPIGHQQRLSILNMSDNDVTHQFDPFFAECRAFGRLKECGLDGDAAVHCYGYIILPPAFKSIATRFKALIWDRASESQPF